MKEKPRPIRRGTKLYLRNGVLVLPVGREWLRVGIGPDGVELKDPEGYWANFFLHAQSDGIDYEEWLETVPRALRQRLMRRGFLETRNVEYGQDDSERGFFLRVESYLGRVARESGPEGRSYLKRLRQSTVWLIGLGGAGSHLSWALASSGVGNVVGIDSALVDPPDLSRQLYMWEALGRNKSDSLMQWLEQNRPLARYYAFSTHVENGSDLDSIASHAPAPDAIVLTADTPPLKLRNAVNLWCVQNGVPYFFVGLRETEVVVGPLIIPGETACFGCWAAARERINPEFFQVGGKGDYERSLRNYGFPSIVGPLWLGSGMILTDLLRLLAFGKRSYRRLWLYGREYSWSVFDKKPRVESWQIDCDCKAQCGACRE